MLVLALDTTTRRGSCALVHDGRTLREDVSQEDRPHATRLPADLMMLLARCDIHLRDIDVFAVAAGPGSFTGLRIGIAAMQGLSFACRRPLLGASTLDALARASGPGRVLAWVDAWRGEVYSAMYDDGVPLAEPVVARPQDILASIDGPVTCVGDGAGTYRALIEGALGPRARVHDPVQPPLAGIIAALAAERVGFGERPGPEAIRAIYVRRPDALLAREVHGGR